MLGLTIGHFFPLCVPFSCFFVFQIIFNYILEILNIQFGDFGFFFSSECLFCFVVQLSWLDLSCNLCVLVVNSDLSSDL